MERADAGHGRFQGDTLGFFGGSGRFRVARHVVIARLALLATTGMVALGLVATPASAATSVTSVTGPSPSTNVAGMQGIYSVGFTTSTSGALTGGTGTVTLAAPSGTVFPSAASGYLVNGTAVTTISGGASATVTITIPTSITIGTSTAVTVVANGVTNPAAGTGDVIAVSTSSDTGAVDTPAYSIYAADVTGFVYAPGTTTGVQGVYVETLNPSGQPTPGGGVVTDSTGAFALYLAGTAGGTAYTLDTFPPAPASCASGCAVSTSTPITVGTSPITQNITLQSANVYGYIYPPGTTSGTTGLINADIVGSSSTGMSSSTSSDADGSYGIYLPGGTSGTTYTITANPPSSGCSTPCAAAQLSVTVSSAGVPSPAAPDNITLNAANVTGFVYAPGTTTGVQGVNVQVTDSSGQQIPGVYANTSSTGAFALYLAGSAGGTAYTLDANPPPPASCGSGCAVSTSTPITVGTSPITQNITLQGANVYGYIYPPGTTSGTTGLAGAGMGWSNPGGTMTSNLQMAADGSYGIYMPGGTSGTTYAISANPPSSGCSTPCAAAQISVTVSSAGVPSPAAPDNITLNTPNVTGQVLDPAGQGVANAGINAMSTTPGPSGAFATTNSSGSYSLYLPDGTWTLQVNPPMGSNVVSGSVTVTVSGGVVTQVNGATGSNPVNVTLQAPNVTGFVYAPGTTTGVANAYIQADDPTTNLPVQNAFEQTDSTGKYGIYLPAGTYNINAFPPPTGCSNCTQGETTITVGSSGTITAGSPNITLPLANLTGKVYAPGTTTGVQYSYLSVNDPTTGQPVNGAFAQTDSSGTFGMTLPDGTFTVNANPPMTSSGGTSYAATACTVTLSGTPAAVTSVTGTGCTLTGGQVDITLTQPNVNGIVYAPGGTTAVSGSFIQAFDTTTNQFVANSFAQSGSTGTWGLSLVDGTYQITAQPPFDSTGSSPYTPATCMVTVSGSPAVVTAVSGTGCSLASGLVDIDLSSPNVFGQVLEPDGITPVSNTGIQVFNTTTQQPLNIWAGTDQSGKYALNLPDGSYSLTAMPPFDNSGGFGTGSVNITVSGGALTGATNPVNIDLTTPNVHGFVYAPGTTTGMPGVGINVQDTASGQYLPGSFAGTDGSGAYSLTLPAGTYTLTAFPPFGGGTTTSPTSCTVSISGTPAAVTTFTGTGCTQNGTDEDITFASPNVSGVVTSSGTAVANAFVEPTQSGRPVDGSYGMSGSDGSFGMSLPNGTYDLTVFPPPGNVGYTVTTCTGVTVSGGSVTGVTGSNCSLVSGKVNIALVAPNVTGVVKSSGGVVLANANINVQDSSGNWVDAWANTDSSGNFGLSLPPGTYTVTAMPPWNGTTTDGPGSVSITVGAGGTCTSCPVTINLIASNVSGTLYESNGTTPVAGAFVEVRNHTTQSDVPNEFGMTNASGAFSLALPNGTYDLIVHPPFTNPAASTQVTIASVAITGGALASCGSATGGTATCSGSAMTIDFGSPNFTGTVEDSSGHTVANVWVQAFDATSGNPIDAGALTGLDGTFAMSLPASSSVILTAFPPPDSTSSVPTSSSTITVNGTGTASPATATIQFQAPNVTGTVFQPDGTTPVPYTGVDVLNSSGAPVTGAHAFTDSTGNFSLSLPAGTYTLVAHAPYSGCTNCFDGTASLTVPASGTVTQNVTLTSDNFSGTVDQSIANGGHPVVGAIVSAALNGCSSNCTVVSTVSGTGGAFSMFLPVGGTYTISVVPPDGDTTDSPNQNAATAQTVPASGVTLNLG